jgi:hypothetical protein
VAGQREGAPKYFEEGDSQGPFRFIAISSRPFDKRIILQIDIQKIDSKNVLEGHRICSDTLRLGRLETLSAPPASRQPVDAQHAHAQGPWQF